MSDLQKFRSAFNGFNREDVVRYLEYMTAKHTAQVNQLTGENEYLRAQLDQYQDVADSRELEKLRTQCAALQAQVEELLSIRAAMEARCDGMERELEEARENQATVHCRVEQELETYRRAERIEREARERADLIYTRTNAVLADAAAQVDAAAANIVALADTVTGPLQQLQTAVGSSKQALKTAAEALYTLQPK